MTTTSLKPERPYSTYEWNTMEADEYWNQVGGCEPSEGWRPIWAECSECGDTELVEDLEGPDKGWFHCAGNCMLHCKHEPLHEPLHGQLYGTDTVVEIN